MILLVLKGTDSLKYHLVLSRVAQVRDAGKNYRKEGQTEGMRAATLYINLVVILLLRYVLNLRGGIFKLLCTGGTYYVTYIFCFISNKSWDGGEGRGGFT